jgi:TRAP-type C4-dicarboxylate transport system permease small subunit
MNMKLIAVIVGVFLSWSVYAALPSAATDAFTTLQTDGLALINAAWPVVGAIVVGFILIKLFRRAANKV